MGAHVERRTTIERELRAAIAEQSIEVHYQPLVHLDGDRIIGFEALARWNSPTLGVVFPNVFMTIAEECGLIHRLGDQLLRTACREAMNWPGDFTLAFNISPLQLQTRPSVCACSAFYARPACRRRGWNSKSPKARSSATPCWRSA